MILHLLSEPKFDFNIIKQIEECCPDDNLFLILVTDNSIDTIKDIFKNKIVFPPDFTNIDFSTIDGVIIHFLSIAKAKLIIRIPKGIPIGWSIWGGDFYNFLPEFKKKIYSGLAIKYLNRNHRRPWFYYTYLDKIIFPNSENYKLWRKAKARIKIYSTVTPFEKDIVHKYFKPATKYLPLPTYSIEKVVDINDYESTICTKERFRNNILVGNSGHPSNNHLEILNFIKLLDKEDITVQLPLTYGSNDYISYICETGNSLLGKRFRPLIDHLSSTEYLNYINSFNVFIFNNYRQQGIGTILLALWSGGKVYLSNKNVTSSFFRDNGIILFSIEDDLFTSKNNNKFSSLTKEAILANRKGLLKLYSNERVNNSIKYFIENLKKSAIN